jgi:hypothetical protein
VSAASEQLPFTDAEERAAILRRLERFPQVHIARASGIAAAKVLADRGQVLVGWEDGMCIVRRLTDAPRPGKGPRAA